MYAYRYVIRYRVHATGKLQYAFVNTGAFGNMVNKHGNTVNFVPTSEHYDACDKMCMAWSNYVHKLSQPDEYGNTYYTDALTFKYLDHIVQNMRHPWIGTARIIEMTPARRAALRKMRPPTKTEPVRSNKPYIHPRQCGEKMHDTRTLQRMYCCDCGMDFYDHHDISTRVPGVRIGTRIRKRPMG